MCGITASIALVGRQDAPTNASLANDASTENLDQQLSNSLATIHHRGPDSRCKWTSHDGLVGLGITRLKINDLTPTGDQPFQNSTKTITAVVNGEIYNHEALRKEILEKTNYSFRGRSDCECVLALYEHYGTSFLSKVNGEYAFCIYDSSKQIVVAGRDRSGVKPLYWSVVGGRLLIASEAKALRPLGWKAEWDIRSLRDAGWNTEDRTMFRGLEKTIIEHRSEEEMIDGLRTRLLEAVRLRLQADVPVGVYLSGGIDSSVIAGMAKHLLDSGQAKLGSEGDEQKLTCLSLAFAKGSGYDESGKSSQERVWLED
ncbi:MAG: hypothetical protein Q9195_007173 [Heterodermia aff. obscurata]